MLKIGEFSKLSHLTIKALRFYEKEGLLIPSKVDQFTGYRFYTTSKLNDAAKIKSFRQIGLTIDEIKSVLNGDNLQTVLNKKSKELIDEKQHIDIQLSIISHLLEEKEMKYQVIEKTIPATTVYYSETVLKQYQDIMTWIPSLGEEFIKLNPDIQCIEPGYEFCEYLDGEYKETNIKVRHNEAITRLGKENELIQFREIPETTVLSIYHQGSYNLIGEAYSYIMEYAKENGYQVAGLARESYIDGIWNKESEEEWLTEIQLPIQK